jgi:potassium-dependent mechanosensitive channel
MGKALQLFKIWCAIILGLWIFAGSASAFDEAVIGQAERAALAFRADLQKIEADLGSPIVSDQQLIAQRDKLEDIRSKALTQAGLLDDSIKEMGEQVAKLGPAPAEGQSEAGEIQAQRKIINDTFNRLQGARTQLELVAVEAEQQTGRASSIQRDQFFQKIFESSRSVLNPFLWADAGVGVQIFFQRVSALINNWWNDVNRSASATSRLLLPIMLAIIVGLWWFISQFLWHRIRRRVLRIDNPNNLERLWRVVQAVLGTIVLLAVLIFLIFGYLQSAGFLTPRFSILLGSISDIFFNTLVWSVLAYRLAAPKQPNWRLVDLDNASASRFAVLAACGVALSSASGSFSAIADGINLPVAYSIGFSAFVSCAMIAILALLLVNFLNQPGLAEKDSSRILYFQWAKVFTVPMWLLLLVAIFALLFGYIALSNFIAFKLADTALLIVVLFLFHHLADAAVHSSLEPDSQLGKFIRRVSGIGERSVERTGLLFRVVVDVMLVLIGFPIFFLLWTVTWVDFRALVNKAFFGFDVGSVTISPWSILLVGFILFGGIALTKLFVRWLNKRILAETRIDKGVQDSLRKGATYAGYIVAAGIALTAAGLNFSNLAIIAGALGVGIGFGLQSIVNNFVSGLILLAERPVRVGDWVSVAAGEGLVKKINVRATEIETFDGCSIIVPNSNLITEVVKNWTHSDTMGRFTVNVSVAYDSDVELVKALLFQLTKAHPNVLTYPEPVVTLQKLGTYSLDFEIKGTVGDIFYGVFVASDIRISILKAFKEKDIVIPVPSVVSVVR